MELLQGSLYYSYCENYPRKVAVAQTLKYSAVLDNLEAKCNLAASRDT